MLARCLRRYCRHQRRRETRVDTRGTCARLSKKSDSDFFLRAAAARAVNDRGDSSGHETRDESISRHALLRILKDLPACGYAITPLVRNIARRDSGARC
jgi:hypothetical protein